MENLSFVFIVIGLFFDLSGCIGLIRIDNFYLKLQAALKGGTMGTVTVLFGVFLTSPFSDAGVKCILCIIMLFIISPVAAHSIAKAYYKKIKA